MPRFLSLAAPGSPCCLLRRTLHLNHPTPVAIHTRPGQRPPSHTLHSPCFTPARSVSSCSSKSWRGRGTLAPHEGLEPSGSHHVHDYRQDQGFPEHHMDMYLTMIEASEQQMVDNDARDATHHPKPYGGFQRQPSRNARKARRQSQPAYVLKSLPTSAQDLYAIAPEGKLDLSYNSPRHFEPGGGRRRISSNNSPRQGLDLHVYPNSLHSILARYLRHHTALSETASVFEYTRNDLDLLRSKGFEAADVEKWAASLLSSNSLEAAEIFKYGVKPPPFFLVLLCLRRKRVQSFALGTIMRHVEQRVKADPLSWKTLKILFIRLVRHARKLWPESLPWVAALFVTGATRIHDNGCSSKPLSHRTLSDMTRFCNTFLALLSLPTSLNPMIASGHQQKAQFLVLQFMASRTPAIIVTRTGFRSVTRNQLAHPKTAQEREWAELKGRSWPPWKEDRTAMDEEKGYTFGASRASKILHRMYEAGYGTGVWEQVAEIYAGWDTDLSPTIQTRTSLPRLSSQFRDRGHLDHLLWAGRIRTTRTRREAWACFLAHESSGAPAHQEIYMAMFEKLYHLETKRSRASEFHPDVIEDYEEPTDTLLPGDMKEVSTDPTSPLHLVHLSEPIPTYEQLYDRMCSKGVRPTARFLAFLLETHPQFETILKMLELAKLEFDGGIGHLISGQHSDDSSVHQIPGYFMAAFIRFLCRFGRFHRPSSQTPKLLSPEQHAHRFKRNRHYLLDYAHALLLHYKPHYRPAWTAFMHKVAFGKFESKKEPEHQSENVILQYSVPFNLVEKMANMDLDIDDVQFHLLCTVTRYAAQAAYQGILSAEDAQIVLSTGSPRLRALFHTLVGANAETHAPDSGGGVIPPHIPAPAELHAYVRALGMLRDYEGLYSLSSWLARHQVEVTARARAQHSGSKMLFRTLVALRAALGGWLEEGQDKRPKAPEDITLLVKQQIESVEEWGGWPSQKYVQLYIKGQLRTSTPGVGGR